MGRNGHARTRKGQERQRLHKERTPFWLIVIGGSWKNP